MPRSGRGRGGKEWEFGISRGKLLHIAWINNKVILYSTGNYFQYSVTHHSGKEYEKDIGTSLVVQWLRLHTSTAGGAGLAPGQGTMIPHAKRPKKKGIYKCITESLCGIEEINTVNQRYFN